MKMNGMKSSDIIYILNKGYRQGEPLEYLFEDFFNPNFLKPYDSIREMLSLMEVEGEARITFSLPFIDKEIHFDSSRVENPFMLAEKVYC